MTNLTLTWHPRRPSLLNKDVILDRIASLSNDSIRAGGGLYLSEGDSLIAGSPQLEGLVAEVKNVFRSGCLEARNLQLVVQSVILPTKFGKVVELLSSGFNTAGEFNEAFKIEPLLWGSTLQILRGNLTSLILKGWAFRQSHVEPKVPWDDPVYRARYCGRIN